ncbi:MAG: phosphomannose isomerase type II C-terminal cupin domain [Candidatus Doudnabacteria bacterium]
MAKNAQDYEQRPWGSFKVLAELENEVGSKNIVIKRLEVEPGKRLSYQQHKLRAEHWFVISGSGQAIINDQAHALAPGQSVQIQIGDKHRIDNRQSTEPLVFIEITTGEFDEFDNERLEDDFDRDSNWRNTEQ